MSLWGKDPRERDVARTRAMAARDLGRRLAIELDPDEKPPTMWARVGRPMAFIIIGALLMAGFLAMVLIISTATSP